jgi:hypothetical protein
VYLSGVVVDRRDLDVVANHLDLVKARLLDHLAKHASHCSHPALS